MDALGIPRDAERLAGEVKTVGPWGLAASYRAIAETAEHGESMIFVKCA